MIELTKDGRDDHPAGTCWSPAVARFERASRHGFTIDQSTPWAPFAPKPGSHDDGSYGGPFLGGIGGPSFARSIEGCFDRWHLEPGVHAHQDVPSCFLAVSWEQDGVRQGRKLMIGDGGFRPDERRYATLFPLTYELYEGDLPFALLLEIYSPTIPHDLAAAELPVTIFNVYARAGRQTVADVRVSLFWTNLLGWTQFAQSAEHRTGRLWPAFSNSGNTTVPIDLGSEDAVALSFRRDAAGDATTAAHAETVIAARGVELERELCFMAAAATTGVAAHKQRFTIDHVAHRFLTTGHFPAEEQMWHAHWNEPIGGALAAALPLATSREARAQFVVANDWPDLTFGAGRSWRRRYAAGRPAGDHAGAALAAVALNADDRWLAIIDRWQRQTLKAFGKAGIAATVAGAALNELSFVAGGGGGAWVTAPAPGGGAVPPFTAKDHFALLEGYDTGYYYYNTSDLWVYAFAALTQHWPALADSVFDDYLDTIMLTVERRRPTYRYGAVAPLLAAGKIPHDLGSPADDPWFRLNGYAMRDDPNLWKDHNPAFVLAYLLHQHLLGRTVDASRYEKLRAATDFVRSQITGDTGVPEHEEFGDSTWDALLMIGLSSYTGGLCLGMWAAMERLAGELGRFDDAADFAVLRQRASRSLDRLWNSEFFVVNDKGKYRTAVMADALWGVFYARLMGLGDLIDVARIRSHLRAVYRYGFQAYANGTAGPLLVSEPGRQRYERDGGEELQTNEVLAGPAWMYVAMLDEYGLAEEAGAVAGVLRDMIYGGSGLQFRTPAAWNAAGQYRAPLNMRPLSVWLVGLSRRRHEAK